MMSKVTTKFQITIPQEVRAALNITPGVDVMFRQEGGRFYIVKNSGSDPVEKWRGALKARKTTDKLMEELRGYGVENID
jgi:AbrB family looped-hinge helix DNA binding protein